MRSWCFWNTHLDCGKAYKNHITNTKSWWKWIKVQSVQIASNPLFHMFTTFTLCHTYTIIRQFSRVRNVHISDDGEEGKDVDCGKGFSFCRGQITHLPGYKIHFVGQIVHHGGQIISYVERKMFGLGGKVYDYLIMICWPILTCVRLKRWEIQCNSKALQRDLHQRQSGWDEIRSKLIKNTRNCQTK